MNDVKMPKRWFYYFHDEKWVEDMDGNWVKAEDVESLVAEITRLRARVEVLERVLHGAVAESHNFVKRVIKEAKP
jgi:hypothetical protein